MGQPPPSRLGDVSAMARVVRALPSGASNGVQKKRQMVADFCRLLGAEFSAPSPDVAEGLPPRHAQTLRRLLAGDSEKQIALHLGVSPHTVHVYVKALYRRFDVSSRAELLARFIRQPQSPQRPEPSPD